jgi:hypothetical protein
MKVLYHASPIKNLRIIKPKKTLSRDIYIGDYVFATSDIRLAAMYLATKGNATLMNVKADIPTIVICSEQKDYLASDKGGAIYTVPATTFKKTPQEGLEDSELISSVAVKPLSKKVYERSIDALKEMGIVIYFVNNSTFNKLVRTKDEAKIISSLQPFRSPS